MVLSEVAKRLVMMSGSGASTCTAECGTNRHQPIDRGHHDYRPSGTSPARRTGPGTNETRLGRLRLAPVDDVPSTQMQWRITAIFRAMATFTFFPPIRFANFIPQALSEDHFFVR
jgi:hypothetical protein